jgi:NTE family protein
MAYPFRNLVFEGGGVKGIGYVGALQVLEDRGILGNVTRVGGTSAGAINAVLLACGYGQEETRQVLSQLGFKAFMDDSWGGVRDTHRLINEYGWYKGDFFHEWMGARIEAKTGNAHSTFNDFKNKKLRDLYLVGTNLSTGFAEVFSAEHTPRVRVADAARVSMSIPLFFAAVRNPRNDVYVDGGLFDNYPVKLFDREKYVTRSDRAAQTTSPSYYDEANRSKPAASSKYVYNKQTLGFRLDSEREVAVFRDGAEPQRQPIDDFFDYTFALLKSIMNVQNNQHLHSDDWHRTVYINTLDVGTVDFGLEDEKKEALVAEGAKGTKKYLDWYDRADPDDLPRNLVEADG